MANRYAVHTIQGTTYVTDTQDGREVYAGAYTVACELATTLDELHQHAPALAAVHAQTADMIGRELGRALVAHRRGE